MKFWFLVLLLLWFVFAINEVANASDKKEATQFLGGYAASQLAKGLPPKVRKNIKRITKPKVLLLDSLALEGDTIKLEIEITKKLTKNINIVQKMTKTERVISVNLLWEF